MNKFFTLVLCFFAVALFAQSLPKAYHFSEDGRILSRGGKIDTTGLFNKNEVKTIKIYFDEADFLDRMISDREGMSDRYQVASIEYEGERFDSVGVRIRGLTSFFLILADPDLDKYSFRIKLNEFIDGQTIGRYNNLRLNNQFADASFMRDAVYSRLASKYTPMPQVNFIHLFLNDEDWGVYANVQMIDNDFIEEWFPDDGGARFRAGFSFDSCALAYLGENVETYESKYTLQSSKDIDNPYERLLEATRILDEASEANYEMLEQFFDVDNILWHLAVENIFADTDSYIEKGWLDYKIYIDPQTGRLTTLEYDGNEVLLDPSFTSGIGPFYNSDINTFALLHKLLNIQEYRQRYLAHYRTLREDIFNRESFSEVINEIRPQIDDLVRNDNKTNHTHSAFTSEVDFLAGIVETRFQDAIMNNAEYQQRGPDISWANHYNANNEENGAPNPSESVWVNSMISSTEGISEVNLYYSQGYFNTFNKIEMFDDGQHNDEAANDGIFGAEIPGFAAGTLVRYYIQAKADNGAKTHAYLPAGASNTVFIYQVETLVQSNGVVINEFLASNDADTFDEAGEYDDWIELYNNNDFEVDLSNFFLSDKTDNITKWQFPEGTTIGPNDYLILWADEDGAQGPLHTNFKLSASGENIILSDQDTVILDQVDFGEQMTDLSSARVPNGTGDFVIQATTFNANNEGPVNVEIQYASKKSPLIYPNPANTRIFIDSEDSGVFNYQLFNAMGQSVIQGQSNPHREIDISSLAPGFYILKIGAHAQTLVIQ